MSCSVVKFAEVCWGALRYVAFQVVPICKPVFAADFGQGDRTRALVEILPKYKRAFSEFFKDWKYCSPLETQHVALHSATCKGTR